MDHDQENESQLANKEQHRKEKAKKKPGRPSHNPSRKNRKIVRALAGFGIPEKHICHVLGITIPTLRVHYGEELEKGKALVEAQLVNNLMRLASGDDGTALKATIFALCTRFGWSQYAPLPPPRDEPLGKKEIANQEAITAHEDTPWAGLVN